MISKPKFQRSDSGMLTMDFLFSFTLVTGFAFLIFFVCFTLSGIEVAQYISFSSARSYIAANIDKGAQEALALKKYNELMNQRSIIGGYLFNSNKPFFALGFVKADDFSGEFGQPPENQIFQGVRLSFQSKALARFRIPFFGKASTDPDEDFKTNISSYLMREPTDQECASFEAQRWQAIKQFSASAGNLLPPTPAPIVSDNGCAFE